MLGDGKSSWAPNRGIAPYTSKVGISPSDPIKSFTDLIAICNASLSEGSPIPPFIVLNSLQTDLWYRATNDNVFGDSIGIAFVRIFTKLELVWNTLAMDCFPASKVKRSGSPVYTSIQHNLTAVQTSLTVTFGTNERPDIFLHHRPHVKYVSSLRKICRDRPNRYSSFYVPLWAKIFWERSIDPTRFSFLCYLNQCLLGTFLDTWQLCKFE